MRSPKRDSMTSPGDDRAPRLSARDGESGAGPQCKKSRELPAAGCASTSGGPAHPSVLRWTMQCAANHVDAGPAAAPAAAFVVPAPAHEPFRTHGLRRQRWQGTLAAGTPVEARGSHDALAVDNDLQAGGCVEIAVAAGGFPYSLATPSMSPADNRSDPTGIPGGGIVPIPQ